MGARGIKAGRMRGLPADTSDTEQTPLAAPSSVERPAAVVLQIGEAVLGDAFAAPWRDRST